MVVLQYLCGILNHIRTASVGAATVAVNPIPSILLSLDTNVVSNLSPSSPGKLFLLQPSRFLLEAPVPAQCHKRFSSHHFAICNPTSDLVGYVGAS